MKRTLVLRREAFTELDPADLAQVAGGHDGPTQPLVPCVLGAIADILLSFNFTCGCDPQQP